MLFNSLEFILVFLPITLIGFFVLARWADFRFALSWLTLASLFFYGWWNPKVSTTDHNLDRVQLSGRASAPGASLRTDLTFGLTVNLSVLAFYKYAGFVADNVEAVSRVDIALGEIVLPLGISFFTFQKIAYLIDAYRGEIRPRGFTSFALFVTFFPQLIAGPIVHHKEIIPQLERRSTYRFDPNNVALGVSIFSLGLFKKVALGDNVANYATPLFDAAQGGYAPTLFEAWGGALAYTLQLYFDFSGYSDMAVGLGRMFNIRLPINFNSPYKAVSIIDFWRRWHITLSRFLRDYLYIPLGGSRLGIPRRYANLMTTMLLGGLWHGAGWTFVFWGGLHGFFLVINHAWHALRHALGHDLGRSTWPGRLAGRSLTFIAVVVGWVCFRSESLDAAGRVLAGMAGLNGVWLPASYLWLFGPLGAWFENAGWRFETLDELLFGGVAQMTWLVALLAIVFLLPNTQEWVRYFGSERMSATAGQALLFARLVAALPRWWSVAVCGSVLGAIFCYCLLSIFAEAPSEFLYFQF